MAITGITGSGGADAMRQQLLDKLFKKLDANGDGKVSKDELAAQVAAGPAQGGPQRGGPPAGAPPAGGPPGAGASGGGAGTSQSSSTATKILDPADANGDGKVSAAERRAYDYKLLMKSLAAATQGSGRKEVARASSSNEASRSVVV
jgi:Ca2+-binding EF-hand superfamily protein